MERNLSCAMNFKRRKLSFSFLLLLSVLHLFPSLVHNETTVNVNFANMLNGFSFTSCPAVPNQCPNQSPVVLSADTSPVKNLWKSFSREELDGLVNFLLSQRSLNLTPSSEASLTDNYIYSLEVALPNKAQALRFLDGLDSTPPTRKALVTVYEGTIALVKFYEVGPVPVTSATMISDVTPTPVPFNLRPLDSVEENLIDIYAVKPFAAKVEKLMRESYGGATYSDNCTLCLTTESTSPSGSNRNERSTWYWFLVDIPGLWLRHTGLEILIQHDSLNPDDFKITKIVYNLQYFTSVEDLINAYNNNSIDKIRLNVNETQWSTFERRGEVRKNDLKSPPKQFEPSGKRYTVYGNDRAEWMGWELGISYKYSTGISLWDIRFKGERIVYEHSLQEAAAGYGGYSAAQSASYYMDSAWGMGASAYELKAGIDCPDTATFIDSHFHYLGSTFTTKNSICIFEQADMRPIKRHYESGDAFKSYSGTPSSSLVVRTINAVANYDYIFEYIFYLNGVVESRISTSGYLQSIHWNDLEADYGVRVQETAAGSLHFHTFNYKVDLDVAGTQNTLVRLIPVTKKVKRPWHDQEITTIAMNKTPVKNETGLRWVHTQPELWSVVNTEVNNRWNNHKAYMIHIHSGLFHNIFEGTEKISGSTWSKYPLTVTKRKESEQASGSPFNQEVMQDPLFDFESFLNGEDIQQQDLVFWTTLGIYHLPSAEDIPTTTSAGNSVSLFLKPHNYFDEDQSTDLSSTQIITPKEDGSRDIVTYEPSPAICTPNITGPAFNGDVK